MSLNLTSLFWSGITHDQDEHKGKEVEKLGNLRAGDSGAMTRGGDIVGGCHRKAYLRSVIGLESEEADNSSLLMFEIGKANELVWMDKLKRVWPGLIKQEEEIPTSWLTKSGVKVTGRPDTVLCKADGTPMLGIEHKAICSLWTARDVSIELTPKIKHLMQAAHYAWQLNVPYRLVYTQYVNYAIPGDWAAKMFPPGHPIVEVNEKGSPKHVKPHITIYEIGFDLNGVIQYRVEGSSEWFRTKWQREDIERYYEFVSAMKDRKALGPRPMAVKADGKKASYSDCSYCPLIEVCDKFENNWEKWHEEILGNPKK